MQSHSPLSIPGLCSVLWNCSFSLRRKASITASFLREAHMSFFNSMDQSLCNSNKAVHLVTQIHAIGHPFPCFLASCFVVFSPWTFHYCIVFCSFVTSQPNVHAFTFRKGVFVSGETCLGDEPRCVHVRAVLAWEWFSVLTVQQPHETSPRPALLALKNNVQETRPSTSANGRIRSYSTQWSFPCSWVTSHAHKLLCPWPVKKSFLPAGADWK